MVKYGGLWEPDEPMFTSLANWDLRETTEKVFENYSSRETAVLIMTDWNDTTDNFYFNEKNLRQYIETCLQNYEYESRRKKLKDMIKYPYNF